MADLVTRRVIEIDTKVAAGALANLKSMNDSLSALERGVSAASGVLKEFALGFVASFSFGALVEGVKAAIDQMDELNKTIQKVGVSAEEFQKLQYAARLSGVDTEALTQGLVKLNKALDDVGGNSAASKALAEFGVKSGDSTAEALNKIADAFAKMPDGAHKTAAAVELFGKAGANLIPLLNEGSEGLAKFAAEAEKLGIIIDAKTLKAMEAFNDSIEKLQMASRGGFAQFAAGIVPELQKITNALLAVQKAGDGMRSFGEGVGQVVNLLAQGFAGFMTVLTMVGKALAGIATAQEQLVRGNFRGALEALSAMSDDIKAAADSGANALDELRKEAGPAAEEIAKIKPPDKDEIDKSFEAFTKGMQSLSDETSKAYRELALLRDGMPTEQARQFAAEMIKYKDALSSGEGAQRLAELRERLNALWEIQKEVRKEEEKQAEQIKENAGWVAFYAKLREDENKKILKEVDAELKAQKEYADGWADFYAKQSEAAGKAAYDAVVNAKTMAEAILDPGKKYRDQIQEQQQLFEAGSLSLEEYAANVEYLSDAQHKATQSTEKLNDSSKAFHDGVIQQISNASQQASRSLVDFATGVETSFSDMFTNILKQFAEFLIQTQIMAPLFRAATQFFGFGGAGGGGISFGTAHGAAFDQSGVVAMQQGGVVTQPTVFPFAGGVGLMGEAGPEAVMPLTRMSSGDLGVHAAGAGGPATNVYVINNSSGTKTRTEEKKRSDGGTDIRVMIEDAVVRGFGSGKFDNVLQSNYGVTRQGRV